MKIAFFSESPADEAALKIIVAGILGEEFEETDLPNTIERRSSSHVDKLLPNVIKGVFYWTDADALIVVSDSDDTSVHTKEHETELNEQCRLCQLRKAVAETVSNLKGERTFRVAVGVPVPAIEAWFLCSINPHVNEATWIRKQNGERISYDRKSLKVELYGNDRPAIEILKEKAIESAERLVEDLEQLEKLFPQGFGCLINEIRGWKE